MATKKNSQPVLDENLEEEIKDEPEVTEAKPKENAEAAALKAELEKLRKENEQLKKNSIAAYSTAGSKSDYERVQEAAKKAAEEGLDAWSVKISVRAPRRPAKEDPFYWLSINSKTMQIPANDKYFDLPLPFACGLVDMIQAEWLARDYADSIEEYDPVTNPHRDN